MRCSPERVLSHLLGLLPRKPAGRVCGEELWDSWGLPACRSLPSGLAKLHWGISLLTSERQTGGAVPSWRAVGESCSEQSLSDLHEVPRIVP